MANDEMRYVEATIASGASLSDAIDIRAGTPVAIIIPSWTAANVTFAVGRGPNICVPLYDTFGNEVMFPVQADSAVRVPEDVLRGWPYLQVRSGPSGDPIAQAAARTIGLHLLPGG